MRKAFEFADIEDLRSGGICVPASFVQLKSDVENCLVIEQLPSKHPVASMETFKVTANMSDLFAIKVGDVQMISYSRCLSSS